MKNIRNLLYIYFFLEILFVILFLILNIIFRFDSNKGTLINRVSDESPRISQDLEKMYLNGVFDGRPTYNTKK